jgi:hypothetical protein
MLFEERQADVSTLTDYWYVLCTNIEETIQMAGAQPGADYIALDIMKLAAPFVLRQWNANGLDVTLVPGFELSLPSEAARRHYQRSRLDDFFADVAALVIAIRLARAAWECASARANEWTAFSYRIRDALAGACRYR